MNVRFTRRQCLREGGALLIPVSMCDAEMFTFDLIDGIFTLQYDAVVFAGFERSKMLCNGNLVECFKPRHYDVTQVLYRPHQLVW